MESNQNPNFNFTVGANWDQQKEQLKQQYPQLTDRDLQCERGQEQELFSRLEMKLGKAPEEINQIFNRLNSQNPSDTNSAVNQGTNQNTNFGNNPDANPGNEDDSDDLAGRNF